MSTRQTLIRLEFTDDEKHPMLKYTGQTALKELHNSIILHKLILQSAKVKYNEFSMLTAQVLEQERSYSEH